VATQSPLLSPGTWVQYNAATQNPRAPKPSSQEQTIGLIRQAFTKSDGPYYQVVWNPGAMYPQTGLYHTDQLTQVDQQQAQQIQSELAQGTYTPPSEQVGTQYQQPPIPQQAIPPGQPAGTYIPTATGGPF
jgi:hypothetical protein